jgi:hypothetical protein
MSDPKLIHPAPAPALTSWWTKAKPEGFTAMVERDQLARMKVSTLGKGYTRPISTDELNR